MLSSNVITKRQCHSSLIYNTSKNIHCTDFLQILNEIHYLLQIHYC